MIATPYGKLDVRSNSEGWCLFFVEPDGKPGTLVTSQGTKWFQGLAAPEPRAVPRSTTARIATELLNTERSRTVLNQLDQNFGASPFAHIIRRK